MEKFLLILGAVLLFVSNCVHFFVLYQVISILYERYL